MQIIDGYCAEPNIYADDIGEYNMSLWGTGDYVLPVGEQLGYELVSNNEIRIKDGIFLTQGRRGVIKKGTSESCVIENGTQAENRNDLIVIEYAKDSSTLVESHTLKVIKGTPGETAADPSVVTGDIAAGAVLHQMPLYRVKLEGLTVTAVEKVFTTGVIIPKIVAPSSSLPSGLIADAAETGARLDDLRTDLKTVEYPQITWAEKVTRYSCTLTKFFDTYIKGTIYAYATSTSGQIKITKGTAIRDASFADRDLVVFPVGTFEGNLFNLTQDEYAAVGTSTGTITTTDSASTNIYRCAGVAIAKYDGEKTTLYGWKDTTTSARCTTAIVIDYCIVRTLINKPPVAYPDGE